MKVSILEKSYQRNGISGDGFEVYRIRSDGETLIATITYADGPGGERLDPTTCRVVDPLDLQSHYRGDVIGDALLDAIAESVAEKLDGNA